MNIKELLNFLRYVIFIIAILIGMKIVADSGFMLSSLKFESEKFNIEVSGYEKSVQPDQK